MAPTPILFDYPSSPYSQKVHLFCAAAGITIRSCEQAPVLPRPALKKLGITYRRIPILAIGKDIFADSSLIIDVLQGTYGGLPADPAAKAFEVFGNSLFQVALRMAPPALLEPSFVKDRKDCFRKKSLSHSWFPSRIPVLTRVAILGDKDYASLGPSARAELRASLDVIEREFLGRGTAWINGDEISSSDVMVAWVVRWLLDGWGVGKEAALGKEDFPKVYAWLGRLPSKQAEKVSDDQAVKEILGGDYAVEESAELANDPLEIPVGQNVSVETTDSDSGSHPQFGKLVSVRVETVTVELKNNLRLHFPRRGFIVKQV